MDGVVVECWDLMTKEEQEIVKKHGCFTCSDCRINYEITNIHNSDGGDDTLRPIRVDKAYPID